MKNAAAIDLDFTKSCSGCPIRHRAVCSRCDSDELTKLEKIKYYTNFEPGQTIALRGDEMQSISSVVQGTATLSRVMEDGRTQMLGLLLPSDFIGRPGREHLQYDVTAVSEVTLCNFKRKPFEELVYCTPHLGERLMEMALDELDAAREWMLLLGRKTAREKVASFLTMLYLRNLGDPANPGQTMQLDLPITRDAMSSYLGLTIETVSRQLSRLKAEGVIEPRGKKQLIIHDFDTLLIEAGDDDGGIIS